MPLLTSFLALTLGAQTPGTVEVPFRIGENAIIVDATLNNANVSLMFDTGFSGTMVLSDTIDIGKPTGTMTLRDFVGEFQAKTTPVKTLKLGAMTIDPKDKTVIQQPMGHISFSYNTHTDGIMGLEVIRSNVTEINFEKRRFIFHPKSYDISTKVPDNKRTFLAKLLPIGHDSLEMEVIAPSGKSLILALDTGNAFYATTHKDVLERVGLWTSGKQPQFMKESQVASGAVDSWSLRLNNMKIFGVPVPTSVWDIIDAPSSSAEGDGTVGFGFLKNFNITFDFERRRVWLENFSGKVSEDPAAETGVFALSDPRAKALRVIHVVPESPAAKAGIKEDDTILSVDGEDLAGKGYYELRAALEGPKGSKVRLVVSHNGIPKRYEIERTLLINE